MSQIAYGMTFNFYQNARFNYTIDYPFFLKPQGESENGDGQIIKDKNAELTVYGSYAPDNIDEAFKFAVDDLKLFKITSTIKNKDNFVINAENNTQIVYFKTIFICNENINMRLYYPKNEKIKWQPLVLKISQSFKYAWEKCKE